MDQTRKIPGDRLRIPADTYNAFVEAAMAHRASRLNLQGGALDFSRTQTLVKVRNDTGANRLRFQIVGLDTLLNYDGFDTQDMRRMPLFSGVTPDATEHAKRFAILQEDLPSDKIGYACIAGFSYVDLVPSITISDSYAAIIDGDYYLEQGTSGGADVLYVYNGVGSTVPAIVRIPSTTINVGGLGARVYHSSNQTVTPSGLALDFGSEDYDSTPAFHDGSQPKRLTVSEAGRYLVGANIEIDLPNNNNNAYLNIRANGSALIACQSGHKGDNGGLVNLNCSTILNASGGDYYEIWVDHDDPMGNATVNSTSGLSPYFWIQSL